MELYVGHGLKYVLNLKYLKYGLKHQLYFCNIDKSWNKLSFLNPRTKNGTMFTTFSVTLMKYSEESNFIRFTVAKMAKNFTRSKIMYVSKWIYLPKLHDKPYIRVRAYDLAYDYPPPPTLSKSYAVGLPYPQKVASHTQSIFTLPNRPKSYAVCPTPYQDMTFQLKSINFTTKIQYDGINFAKNGRFAPIFASINIKSHYLHDLN